jgi:hypothetical protein
MAGVAGVAGVAGIRIMVAMALLVCMNAQWLGWSEKASGAILPAFDSCRSSVILFFYFQNITN